MERLHRVEILKLALELQLRPRAIQRPMRQIPPTWQASLPESLLESILVLSDFRYLLFKLYPCSL